MPAIALAIYAPIPEQEQGKALTYRLGASAYHDSNIFGAATGEISRNVGEAAKGTAQVASNITDVNRGASETGSASAQVLSSAQSLANESNRLTLEVGKFLKTVRAA